MPPLGPAIPVIETFILALDILDKFLTIAKQHSWLTAPYFLMTFLFTFKTLIFAWLEYVTRPKLNTFDAPLIEVIELANNPPVHDSAKEILIFFFC